MKISLALYDALTSISVPNKTAKAAVNAWEDDVKHFASKADLERTESHLKDSIAALRTDLSALIKDQGVAIREQGVEFRALVESQASQFQGAISKLESGMTLLRWQFWLLVICFGFPIIKNLYEIYGSVISS
ncbi:DUF1640 domain-containing protein [Pseudomonas gessardii]|uniref:DUF1640 domain-containing protein n=3 Tax=Pseudomonas gessardii TaxID=78544 RepID=A0ABS9F667_9PSED|nr:DUF1640 domain-containing protein [Pseudomonas gessardii]MCF4990662.1 DUF1640 domain-containing protein [Pseudomonas gessardii]MCF5087732.1 DUF1640 domain-containing protein [Pseudomonas gessardii]MCF5098344.1 DUF1640 domain-containing protein [Pseudomonas gessardii]MCF5107822.1 DUF1640 domain-containing protein [Pseudomonas gessardii]